MKKFVENNFTVIVLVITVLTFFKGCGDTREIAKVRKEMTVLESRLDVKMKIEGLKSEKRMIQSTDRKLIDVERGIKVYLYTKLVPTIINCDFNILQILTCQTSISVIVNLPSFLFVSMFNPF